MTQKSEERGAAIVRLPDLRRMRAFEARFGAVDDLEACDLLATEEGRWFVSECSRYTSAQNRDRIAEIIADTDFGAAMLGVESPLACLTKGNLPSA